MRTEIKVSGLSLNQWEYLIDKVPVSGREFMAGVPRVCAVFELDRNDGIQLHIEMDIVELTGLIVRFAAIEARDLARAALAPDEPPRLYRLPSADQVVNLTAREAADLAASMNRAADPGKFESGSDT